VPKYSKASKSRLASCHEDLQVLFNEVIKYIDVSIICGLRGQEAQDRAFSDGLSKVKFPNSKHNKLPSEAVDAVPYPIDWKNTPRMRFFAGIILGIAIMLKKQGKMKNCIRWGGDWDSDTDLNDQRFNDLPHFEIADRRIY